MRSTLSNLRPGSISLAATLGFVVHLILGRWQRVKPGCEAPNYIVEQEPGTRLKVIRPVWKIRRDLWPQCFPGAGAASLGRLALCECGLGAQRAAFGQVEVLQQLLRLNQTVPVPGKLLDPLLLLGDMSLALGNVPLGLL